MRVLKRLTFAAATCVASCGALGASASLAYAGLGQPSEWELGLQQAASPIMENIESFHNGLVIVVTAITLFVMALLLIVMVKFNAKANPVPSFRLLFSELDIPKADLTVKATGKQWYWTYTYPDNGPFEFDSLLVKDADLKPGQLRLLTADNELVVPVNKVVRVLTTGADVIHSFAMPAFGIKIDAIPGRINETWFKATKEGTYHGQCSELCGRDHAFMPIVVRVVNDQAFSAWLADAKKKYADNNDKNDSARPTTVAAAQ